MKRFIFNSILTSIYFSSYTRSEDTLILNALTPRVTKIAPIYEAIDYFCEEKTAIDPSSRFNVAFFEESGPNYLEDFTLNKDYILLTLKAIEPVIVPGNIGGGLFIGISFIIQAFKTIGEKAFRLIVFSDAGTPKIAPKFIPVLENLIDQVKDMPLFIDIIRIKVDDPEEDVKLEKLTERCGGSVYHIKKLKELPKLIENLALKKKIKSSSIEDGKYVIPEESQLFFINLAEDLVDVKEHGTCSVCFEKDAKDLSKCNKCGTLAHKSCRAQWAEKTSIGVPHVFRCFNCYNLIKLKKEYIENIKKTKVLEHEIDAWVITAQAAQEYLESLETEAGPKVIHAENIMGISTEVFKLSKSDITIVDGKKREKTDKKIKFFPCPHCLMMITSDYEICPVCNKRI